MTDTDGAKAATLVVEEDEDYKFDDVEIKMRETKPINYGLENALYSVASKTKKRTFAPISDEYRQDMEAVY